MAVDTLLIDNYDSFTYNLYQYLSELGADVVVHRNDQITLEEIEALEPERIVISPGPKTPVEAGGKVSSIEHDGEGVFAGLPNPIEATRYHSLIVDPETLPDDIVPTAWCERVDGTGRILMGLRHTDYPIEGVQFHPESIRTKTGHAILKNFLDQSADFHRG
ncbi:MAG: aminodeoxychorismate/anthranilate synthase component II [Chloroflexi bacterium]|nr:aminodeoxychorismate/anthranilate synthase component II [Chloroflexota bacterium]